MTTAITQLDQIRIRLMPVREALLRHPIYADFNSMERLHIFMQHHVFAVWDFMSLLKSLQRQICGTQTPWLPPQDPFTARLVNEIVQGEETDEDGKGGFASHYDLYLQSMKDCGASTQPIVLFIQRLRMGDDLETALGRSHAPQAVGDFLRTTFAMVNGGALCEIAAAFAFGREDLLPDVFERVVDELNVEHAGTLDSFRYYLDRHIELDGDHHGPMSEQMIISLCGTDESKWRSAEAAALAALEARLRLWDAIHAEMQG